MLSYYAFTTCFFSDQIEVRKQQSGDNFPHVKKLEHIARKQSEFSATIDAYAIVFKSKGSAGTIKQIENLVKVYKQPGGDVRVYDFVVNAAAIFRQLFDLILQVQFQLDWNLMRPSAHEVRPCSM